MSLQRSITLDRNPSSFEARFCFDNAGILILKTKTTIGNHSNSKYVFFVPQYVGN